MKHLLHKRSSPGWTKEFPTLDAAIAEMLTHVCGECLKGDHEIVGTDERHIVEPPNPAFIGDLLSTPCGCEYEYETR